MTFPAGEKSVPADRGWHPLTRSLLDRAARAGRRIDRPRVERVIREVAEARGLGRLVIKWMETPGRAFEHLSRYGLDELLLMGMARLWHRGQPVEAENEAEAERSSDLYCHAARLLRVEEHDRALTEPKLAAKRGAVATRPDVLFGARAVAAQIGWLETSLPVAAAEAIRAVDGLLTAGHAEGSETIYHQLRAFEACERGLLATWETPGELLCVPVNAAA